MRLPPKGASLAELKRYFVGVQKSTPEQRLSAEDKDVNMLQRKSQIIERKDRNDQIRRKARLNNPILRQDADDVPEFQDPAVWLEEKCHIMTPEEY